MNALDATKLLAEMQERWPLKKLSAETVRFFRPALEKLDFAMASAAVTRLFEKRGSFPSVFDIRKEMGLAVEKPKAPEPQKLSSRGADIAMLLAVISNPTISKQVRIDLAENLWWECGGLGSAHEAGRLAEQTRMKLGWSANGKEAASQIKSGFKPNGIAPSGWDWLKAAGFIDEQINAENLPEPRKTAFGARERLAAIVDKFCRDHGAPVPTRHEVTDERKPYVEPDEDDDERLRRYPPWLRDQREARP